MLLITCLWLSCHVLTAGAQLTAANASSWGSLGNLAAGALPFASGSCLCGCTTAAGGLGSSGTGIHCFVNINDGKVGNDFSWIPADTAELYVGVIFGTTSVVHGVRMSRDATGTLTDRTGTFVLQYTANALASMADISAAVWISLGGGSTGVLPRYYALSAPVVASAIRVVVLPDMGVDELVVYGAPSAPSSCLDGVQNNLEIGVDCGGQCVPCGSLACVGPDCLPPTPPKGPIMSPLGVTLLVIFINLLAIVAGAFIAMQSSDDAKVALAGVGAVLCCSTLLLALPLGVPQYEGKAPDQCVGADCKAPVVAPWVAAFIAVLCGLCCCFGCVVALGVDGMSKNPPMLFGCGGVVFVVITLVFGLSLGVPQYDATPCDPLPSGGNGIDEFVSSCAADQVAPGQQCEFVCTSPGYSGWALHSCSAGWNTRHDPECEGNPCFGIPHGGSGENAYTSSCVNKTTAHGDICTLECSAAGFTGYTILECSAESWGQIAAPICVECIGDCEDFKYDGTAVPFWATLTIVALVLSLCSPCCLQGSRFVLDDDFRASSAATFCGLFTIALILGLSLGIPTYRGKGVAWINPVVHPIEAIMLSLGSALLLSVPAARLYHAFALGQQNDAVLISPPMWQGREVIEHADLCKGSIVFIEAEVYKFDNEEAYNNARTTGMLQVDPAGSSGRCVYMPWIPRSSGKHYFKLTHYGVQEIYCAIEVKDERRSLSGSQKARVLAIFLYVFAIVFAVCMLFLNLLQKGEDCQSESDCGREALWCDTSNPNVHGDFVCGCAAEGGTNNTRVTEPGIPCDGITDVCLCFAYLTWLLPIAGILLLILFGVTYWATKEGHESGTASNKKEALGSAVLLHLGLSLGDLYSDLFYIASTKFFSPVMMFASAGLLFLSFMSSILIIKSLPDPLNMLAIFLQWTRADRLAMDGVCRCGQASLSKYEEHSRAWDDWWTHAKSKECGKAAEEKKKSEDKQDSNPHGYTIVHIIGDATGRTANRKFLVWFLKRVCGRNLKIILFNDIRRQAKFPKLLMFSAILLFYVLALCLFWLIVPLLLVGIFIFWWMLGAMMCMTKCFAVGPLQRGWYMFWCGTDFSEGGDGDGGGGKTPRQRNSKKQSFSTATFNSLILSELSFETIPQLVLTIVNNSLLVGTKWKTAAIISMCFSVFMTFNTLYKIYYYIVQNEYAVADIPINSPIPFFEKFLKLFVTGCGSKIHPLGEGHSKPSPTPQVGADATVNNTFGADDPEAAGEAHSPRDAWAGGDDTTDPPAP